MLAWIVAGLPFDLMHGIGNLFAGLLILPLSELLLKLERKQNL
jgi:energy-coupling factor transport system substrate-specific component